MKQEAILKKVIDLLQKYDAKKIAVFGSYVRGEENKESDIDIVVEFSHTKPSWTCEGWERALWNNWNKSRFVDGKSYKPISDWYNKKRDEGNLRVKKNDFPYLRHILDAISRIKVVIIYSYAKGVENLPWLIFLSIMAKTFSPLRSLCSRATNGSGREIKSL